MSLLEDIKKRPMFDDEMDNIKLGNTMNERQVKAYLQILFNDMLDHIKDDDMRKLIKENTFIAGGVFRSLITNDKINDIDIFFKNKESVDKFITYAHKFFNHVFKPKYGVRYRESDNSIMYVFRDKNPTLQFIKTFYGSVDEVIGRFDFKHTQIAYDPYHDQIINFQDLRTKYLEYNENASHPIAALKRIFKFVKKGYYINDDELLKIIEHIHTLNLIDPKVYANHLNGLYNSRGKVTVEDMEERCKKLSDRKFNKTLDEIINE